MRSNCTQTSYILLFPMLCALACRLFGEVQKHADFPEKVGELFPEFCLVGISLCMWTQLGWDPYSPVFLLTSFLLFILPCTLCLLSWSFTFSLDCWSFSPAPFIPSLKLSLLDWPSCWQKCFSSLRWMPSLLNNPLFSYSFPWSYKIHTSCTINCWLAGSAFYSSHPSAFLEWLRRKLPELLCPWHLPTPCHHTPQRCSQCLVLSWLPLGSSLVPEWKCSRG